MKKSFFTLLLLSFTYCIHAQFGLLQYAGEEVANELEQKKSLKLAKEYLSVEVIDGDSLYRMRVPDDKIKGDGREHVISVQYNLSGANELFRNKAAITNLSVIRADINSITTYKKNWVTVYYQKELAFYTRYEENRKIAEEKRKIAEEQRIQNEKRIQDSIRQAETVQKTIQKQKIEDSVAFVKNPYMKLDRQLWGMTEHKNLAVFCGMDFNFSHPKLSSYIQSEMDLVSKDFNVNQSVLTEKYVPRWSSTGKEYLQLKYYTKQTKNKPYGETIDGMCTTILKCEITGTADYVLDLFISYWPQRIKLGGYKQDEIAFFENLGDKVTLYGVTAPNIYKIVITEGNLKIDYYKTFDIK
jgi:hypothetical protein